MVLRVGPENAIDSKAGSGRTCRKKQREAEAHAVCFPSEEGIKRTDD